MHKKEKRVWARNGPSPTIPAADTTFLSLSLHVLRAKIFLELNVMGCNTNPRTLEAEARVLTVQKQAGLHGESLSQEREGKGLELALFTKQ